MLHQEPRTGRRGGWAVHRIAARIDNRFELVAGALSSDPARALASAAELGIAPDRSYGDFATMAKAEAAQAELMSFVPGRRVDDNAHIRLRYGGGAKGRIRASQVAVGNENALRRRVYGDKGGLDWRQENPNELMFARFGAPVQRLTRGGAGLAAMLAPGPASRRATPRAISKASPTSIPTPPTRYSVPGPARCCPASKTVSTACGS